MRVGQPGVQRCEADLGAVAEQQEHEGDIEQRRIETCGVLYQYCQMMGQFFPPRCV